MQDALDMDQKQFDFVIFDWAAEFGFTIDGEYLNINKESVSDFIDALDKQFTLWESSEKDKNGKI